MEFHCITTISQLTSLHTQSCAPRPKQARKFVRTMLKTSSSCITSMVKRPRLKILSKFGSKELLKKLKNLSLSLRRRPWRFWSWLSGLDWLKLASNCKSTFTGLGSEQPRLYREMGGCFLWGDYEWEEEISFWPIVNAWLLQVIFRDSFIATGTVGQWRRWYRLPVYDKRDSASFLNFHFYGPFPI